MPDRVYLDYNAATPLLDVARDAMIDAMAYGGNPSSVHTAGRAARKCLENARAQVAAAINAAPRDIVFVGSGTEANNLAMEVTRDRRLIIGAAEHDSILAPAKRQDPDITMISPGPDGQIDLDALRANLAEDSRPAMLSFMLMNNETGIIQPIQDIAAIAKEFGAYIHCDAIHGLGKVPVDFPALGVDMMSIAGHKIGGPKGAAALVVREGLGPFPSVIGGGQERRWRAGTENVVGCAGFGAACAAIGDTLDAMENVTRLRQLLEDEIIAHAPDAVIVGADAIRGPNTCSLVMPGISNETQVMQFDLAGFDLSAGSACSSGKVGASHVLQSMGISDELATCAIRISLGTSSTEDQIRAFIAQWCRLYDRSKK